MNLSDPRALPIQPSVLAEWTISDATTLYGKNPIPSDSITASKGNISYLHGSGTLIMKETGFYLVN
jgi:hypothetical protein